MIASLIRIILIKSIGLVIRVGNQTPKCGRFVSRKIPSIPYFIRSQLNSPSFYRFKRVSRVCQSTCCVEVFGEILLGIG